MAFSLEGPQVPGVRHSHFYQEHHQYRGYPQPREFHLFPISSGRKSEAMYTYNKEEFREESERERSGSGRTEGVADMKMEERA